MVSTRTDEFKEIKTVESSFIDPKKIITSYQKHWRIPLMKHVENFIGTPNEEDFEWIYSKLICPIHEKELQEWSKLIAELMSKPQGPRELLLIGLAYLCGKGISQRFYIAFNYFTKVKDINSDMQTSGIALLFLGKFYSFGWGSTPKHPPEAIKLFQEARKKGSIVALQGLGFLLPQQDFNIEGVSKKVEGCYYNLGFKFYSSQAFKQAYECFTQAAILGGGAGMQLLAIMHRKGEYVKQDFNQAALFYRLAVWGLKEGSSVEWDSIVWKIQCILKILQDTNKEDIFFVKYQLALCKKDVSNLSQLAKQDSIKFLQCMADSGDLWNEVKALLTEEATVKIEKPLTKALDLLRERGMNANLAGISFDYLYPEDLIKSVIWFRNKSPY